MKTPIERAREVTELIYEGWNGGGWGDVRARIQEALAAQQAESDARIKELEAVIRWALGEDEDGFPERALGEGRYWWRKELRERLDKALSAGLGEAGNATSQDT